MPITAPIPMPDQPGEALAKGSDWMNKLLAAPYERQEKQASAQHQQALAELERSPEKYGLLRAQIEAEQALAQQRKMGGGGFGAGSAGMKDINAARNYIMNTRGINQQEADDLINRGLNGEDVGLSPLEINMLDQVKKRGTTSALINKGVQANQADAEINAMQEKADKWLKPYGDTTMGISFKQVQDSFKTDDESQERLGKFIASQALQYEIAQIRNRIAGGEPGVTSTELLMKESMQHIKAKYPKLSAKARKYASDALNEGISAALAARNKSGIGATSATGRKGQSSNQGSSNNVASFLLPDGKSVVEIPADKADEFQQEYPDHKRLSG